MAVDAKHSTLLQLITEESGSRTLKLGASAGDKSANTYLIQEYDPLVTTPGLLYFMLTCYYRTRFRTLVLLNYAASKFSV